MASSSSRRPKRFLTEQLPDIRIKQAPELERIRNGFSKLNSRLSNKEGLWDSATKNHVHAKPVLTVNARKKYMPRVFDPVFNCAAIKTQLHQRRTKFESKAHQDEILEPSSSSEEEEATHSSFLLDEDYNYTIKSANVIRDILEGGSMSYKSPFQPPVLSADDLVSSLPINDEDSKSGSDSVKRGNLDPKLQDDDDDLLIMNAPMVRGRRRNAFIQVDKTAVLLRWRYAVYWILRCTKTKCSPLSFTASMIDEKLKDALVTSLKFKSFLARPVDNRTIAEITSITSLMNAFSAFSNIPQELYCEVWQNARILTFQRGTIIFQPPKSCELTHFLLVGEIEQFANGKKLSTQNELGQLIEPLEYTNHHTRAVCTFRTELIVFRKSVWLDFLRRSEVYLDTQYSLISSIPQFQGLDEEAIDRILKHFSFTSQEFSVDTIITAEEMMSKIYFVTQGQLLLIKQYEMIKRTEIQTQGKTRFSKYQIIEMFHGLQLREDDELFTQTKVLGSVSQGGYYPYLNMLNVCDVKVIETASCIIVSKDVISYLPKQILSLLS